MFGFCAERKLQQCGDHVFPGMKVWLPVIHDYMLASIPRPPSTERPSQGTGHLANIRHRVLVCGKGLQGLARRQAQGCDSLKQWVPKAEDREPFPLRAGESSPDCGVCSTRPQLRTLPGSHSKSTELNLNWKIEAKLPKRKKE